MALQILYHGVIHFAEVKFYFTKLLGGEFRAFALVSLYSPPNEYLLQLSYTTLLVCRYQGKDTLRVIDTELILSVVAMVPFDFLIDNYDSQYFMIEKAGLDIVDGDDPKDDVDE